MRGVLIGAGLALAALVLYILSNIIPASGAFTTLTNRLVDSCTALPVPPGPEDIEIDPDTNLAFVSSDDRRAKNAGKPVQGGIYVFDVATHADVRRVSPDDFGEFHPHGISLWRGPNGEKRLFVINHLTNGAQRVEIFDVGDNGALSHVDSVSFDAMRSPNDVLGVGLRQFYATNDRRFQGGVLGALEAWLALPLSSIVYYDGANGKFIRRGLVYANGINMSSDGGTVYASEFLKRRIGVYSRNQATGALTRRKFIHTPMNPDNIDVAEDGGIWVAGDPKIFALLKFFKNPTAIAPSEVIRINPRTDGKSVAFVDTSGKLNASSVGAVWDKTLIVGAIFDDHVMVCPMVEIFLHDAGGR